MRCHGAAPSFLRLVAPPLRNPAVQFPAPMEHARYSVGPFARDPPIPPVVQSVAKGHALCWDDEMDPRPDLARSTIGVLIIVTLIALAIWVLEPFLASTIWAAMIVIATWPVMTRVQQWLW